MPKLHAGLDVADQTTAICVLDHAGNRIFETSVATTPAAIAAALKPFRRSLVGVGQETGTKSTWLHKELLKHRFPMICLDARHANAALAAKANKTDKSDAQGIATLLCRGLFTTAYVKSDESIRVRMILTTRKAMQRKAMDMQMSLRMLLKTFGGRIERKRSGRITILPATGRQDDVLSDLSLAMVRANDALMAEVKTLDRMVARMADEDPVCRRLMSIPGVGPITALTFRAAVDDPTRFKSSRVVAAYFGLTPRRFQSGQMDFNGRITRRGDESTRTVLYAAARALLHVSRSQWSLRLWGLRLAEKKGLNVAIVACARRLAVVMHSMWVSGQEFRPKEPRRNCKPRFGSA